MVIDLGALVADNMAIIRKNRNPRVDQHELLEMLNVSQQVTSKIERHERQITLTEIYAVCRRLDCTLADLLRGAPDEVFEALGLR